MILPGGINLILITESMHDIGGSSTMDEPLCHDKFSPFNLSIMALYF